MALILGIESSCDETSVSVVRNGKEILSCITLSQIKDHAKFRGVVPEIASRKHVEAITLTIDEALVAASIKHTELDAIAVTNRPGLVGALLVGVTAAKSLAIAWGKPIVAVDHIQAHICSALMFTDDIKLPLIAAAISGGHTELYYSDDSVEYTRIGGTIDDAAGEAFDKCAAVLGLPYPGGPSISKAAATGKVTAKFPLPIYRKGDGYDFTFSGIKTAVLYHCKGVQSRGMGPLKDDIIIEDVAASFEYAACQAITKQMIKAAKDRRANTLIIGGGVACNQCLRDTLQAACDKEGLGLAYPPPAYCTDNAAMIAGLGDQLFNSGQFSHDLEFDVRSRT